MIIGSKVKKGRPIPFRVKNKINQEAKIAERLAFPFYCHSDVSKGLVTIKRVTNVEVAKNDEVDEFDETKRLEAWFSLATPIPNNVCWLHEDKSVYLKKTGNSRISRLLKGATPYVEEKVEPSVKWDLHRPLSLSDILPESKSIDSTKPPVDGATMQFLMDNLGNTIHYQGLQRAKCFEFASKETRDYIDPDLAAEMGYYRTMKASQRNGLSKTMRDQEQLFLCPMKVTEGLIMYYFNTNELPWRNSLPEGYTANRSDRRRKIRARRDKSKKNISVLATIAKKEVAIKRYGIDRKPIGLDCDLQRDSEKMRYFAYWQPKPECWGTSRYEESTPENLQYWDEQHYSWWLYNTRMLQPESRALASALCKNDIHNSPRSVDRESTLVWNPYCSLSSQPLWAKIRASVYRWFHLPVQRREANIAEEIDRLEDHLYESEIPNILELIPKRIDSFMLSVARTHNEMRIKGGLDLLVFEQSMPMIIEQLRQIYPLPSVEANNVEEVLAIPAHRQWSSM